MTNCPPSLRGDLSKWLCEINTGVYVGNVFGAKYKNKAEFVGGTILILIGVKIILEHFGVL